MATKTANVMARVAPDVKAQAESIMERQSIPFSLSIPREPLAIDEMDEQTFNAMMEKGYQQALNGETKPINEAFAEIREKL